MNSYRKKGIIVGILYIIGTVTGVLSVALTGTKEATAESLTRISTTDISFSLGAFCILLMGFSLAFIPLIVYPLLKKQNPTFALGYIVFRSGIETITYMGGFVISLLLLFWARYFVSHPTIDFLSIKDGLASIIKLQSLAMLCTVFAFSIGALLFYAALYQSKLIPQWLSLWGIVAIILHLLTGILILFELQTEFSVSNTIMNFPIFLQEMVMAVWLIIKGFNYQGK